MVFRFEDWGDDDKANSSSEKLIESLEARVGAGADLLREASDAVFDLDGRDASKDGALACPKS